MKNKRSDKRGFTLAEVIVVLVILAILAAVFVPSLIGWIKKSQESADKIAALQFSKQVTYAMTLGELRIVETSVPANGYQVNIWSGSYRNDGNYIQFAPGTGNKFQYLAPNGQWTDIASGYHSPTDPACKIFTDNIQIDENYLKSYRMIRVCVTKDGQLRFVEGNISRDRNGKSPWEDVLLQGSKT